MDNVKHSMLPYDISKGPAQKIIFSYKRRTLQVFWTYNTTDECLVIKINDYNELRVMLITKLVDKGIYIVCDKFSNVMFGLFAYNIDNVFAPEVWMLDISEIEAIGELDG